MGLNIVGNPPCGGAKNVEMVPNRDSSRPRPNPRGLVVGTKGLREADGEMKEMLLFGGVGVRGTDWFKSSNVDVVVLSLEEGSVISSEITDVGRYSVGWRGGSGINSRFGSR